MKRPISGLEEIYTKYSTRDFFKKRPLTALARSAFADSKGLAAVVAHYANEAQLEGIARAHAEGRRMLVGTTNLDAMRPVTWRVDALAASGHADALTLYRKILLASAAIPAALPPVRFEVEADGRMYDELHVDGGATSQVFVYPVAFNMKAALEEIGCTAELFVIRNARIDPQWEAVKARLPSIAARSIESLLRVQGFGDLYKIYLETQRDGIDFNLAYIPADFSAQPKEEFDIHYMRQLFDLGREMAKSGYPWEKHPPGYAAAESFREG